MDQSKVGKKIKDKREKAGLSQTELANEAKVTPSAISQIESGERFPSTLVLHKVAKALSTSVDYLLGQQEEEDMSDILKDKGAQVLFRTYKELSKRDRETILKIVKSFEAKGK